MKLITFTGADERTDLHALIDLASEPFVEIGLLYSATPEGRNRYPALAWLMEAAAKIRAAGGWVAIHICGMKAREQLLAGELRDLVSLAGRVQVNGTLSSVEARAAAELVPVLITQHTERNASLAHLLIENHVVLVDDSGGRGISPPSWTAPSTRVWKPFGYAGGLGPQNLEAEMSKIHASAGEREVLWIDMEGKLRNADDWFDVGRARACAEIFRPTYERGLVDRLRTVARTTLHATMEGSMRARERDDVAAAAALLEKRQSATNALREGLSRIKLRLHFMGWPAEDHWNAGTNDKPRWIPDWRHEIQLIEHLLHGSPITTSDKPGDTIPANQLPGDGSTADEDRIRKACLNAGVSASQLEQIFQELGAHNLPAQPEQAQTYVAKTVNSGGTLLMNFGSIPEIRRWSEANGLVLGEAALYRPTYEVEHRDGSSLTPAEIANLQPEDSETFYARREINAREAIARRPLPALRDGAIPSVHEGEANAVLFKHFGREQGRG